MSGDFYAVRFEDEDAASEVLGDTESYDRDPDYLDLLRDGLGKSVFSLLKKFTDTDLEYGKDFIRNHEDIIPRSKQGKKELEKTLEDTYIDYELLG